MFDRLILNEELVGCRGEVIAARGTVLSLEAVAEVARRTPALPRRSLEETPLAADAEVPLDAPVYRHLFDGEGVRDTVRRALLAIRLPAALLHDLGMRHLPARLLRQRERLGCDDSVRVAAHPLLGAYHLAKLLGPHPAVAAAQSHHWRCGQGYPTLGRAPSRTIEVISVASAFAALTQPRPFRPGLYDARGASDVLAAEAMGGHADANTVKLLVHALRGGRGDPRSIRFGREREGHGPDVNRYVHVAAPARSAV